MHNTLARSPESGTGAEADAGLARTPLYALHRRHAARMVAFAGYEMPLQYPPGLLKEHLQTRSAAGLFDVSHMGQITVTPRSGDLAAAARALESLMPIDLLGLRPGRQRYGLLTGKAGGILDDLMVASLGDRFLLIVNAACKAADEAHLRQHLPEELVIAGQKRALLSLQGPAAEVVLLRLVPSISAMRFMDVREVTLMDAPAIVTRSGYTGEDGFELSIPTDRAEAVTERLLDDPAVQLIGLGARDSLRLEAGLCLYGADMDAGISPIEAGLGWAIPRVRRRHGAREGGFPGADRVLDEMARGPVRLRVGLRPEGRIPVRSGAPIFLGEHDAAAAGHVTSGCFGPSSGAPVAMGYVPTERATPGERLFAEVRGQRLPVVVSPLPFVQTQFKRS